MERSSSIIVVVCIGGGLLGALLLGVITLFLVTLAKQRSDDTEGVNGIPLRSKISPLTPEQQTLRDTLLRRFRRQKRREAAAARRRARESNEPIGGDHDPAREPALYEERSRHPPGQDETESVISDDTVELSIAASTVVYGRGRYGDSSGHPADSRMSMQEEALSHHASPGENSFQTVLQEQANADVMNRRRLIAMATGQYLVATGRDRFDAVPVEDSQAVSGSILTNEDP